MGPTVPTHTPHRVTGPRITPDLGVRGRESPPALPARGLPGGPPDERDCSGCEFIKNGLKAGRPAIIEPRRGAPRASRALLTIIDIIAY